MIEDPINLRLMSVQIPMDFSSRNEDAAESWQFPKHLTAHESSDCFFADAHQGKYRWMFDPPAAPQRAA